MCEDWELYIEIGKHIESNWWFVLMVKEVLKLGKYRNIPFNLEAPSADD